MRYELTPEMMTNIGEIDGQHKELFRRVNLLLDAIEGGKGAEEVGEVLSFLKSYVAIHFSTEEDYMVTNDYPGYGSHVGAHSEFRQYVLELKKVFEEEGPTKHLADVVVKKVGDWYFNHIKVADMKYVPFLKDKVK